MSFYIQYHNADVEGLPEENSRHKYNCRIRTKKAFVQKATGTVFLIVGIGRPKRYFLWNCFDIEKVTTSKIDGDTTYTAMGRGWRLNPLQELSGKSFDSFRKSCANFVAFRNIDKLSFCRMLWKYANENRRSANSSKVDPVLEQLREIEANSSARTRKTKKRTLALSIRQPYAEAIMRGTKKIEYRSKLTHVRGRILIYASKKKVDPEYETEFLKEHRIAKSVSDELPRGVIVGSVDLYDCDGGKWYLRNPIRAKRLRKPTGKPQPVWFKPF